METVNLIEKEELLELVPHRGKMFLLSRVTAYDIEKRTLTAEYDISSECLFYDSELRGVPAWAGFECMAQSISALSGVAGKIQGEPARPGFILSVSDMEISIPVLRSGTTIRIEAEEECRVDAVFTFHCSLYAENGKALSARLTVMEAESLDLLNK